ncbi:transcription initiation factor IIB [Halomarina oriensis]|uniref:Transcription initiation factor IIB n=1 Tax=Halomarina oriensis TaxID=671145 RepID=A0A6B0GPB7_9EURY|nr:transcription initiation factor IIB family protein [Halomarina oriensis]MWG35379.1 transcription initiation factor IIB family protein [Halomarina oriensis]
MSIREIYETGFDEHREATTQQTKRCPECDGVVRTNCRETVCEDCGLVLDEQRIDRGPEWRPFDAAERERTGAPLTERRHDRGLSTEIGRKRDGRGKTLPGRKRRQLSRLRRQHSRATWQSTADRNLAHGLGEVRRIASEMELADSIIEQACALFRRAQNEDLLPGRSVEAMAAGAVYAICRTNGLPRTCGDVATLARVSNERVENAYSVLNRDLSLPSVPVPPGAYIPGLASTVGLSEGTRRQAADVTEQAQERGLTNGKHPAGVAAAALYLVAEARVERVRQTDLAAAADVSTVTLRARWAELREHVEVDIV